eukprot:COSAG01_NODE_71380_length_256_cov_0.643312_1_plen_28_part_10
MNQLLVRDGGGRGGAGRGDAALGGTADV